MIEFYAIHVLVQGVCGVRESLYMERKLMEDWGDEIRSAVKVT